MPGGIDAGLYSRRLMGLASEAFAGGGVAAPEKLLAAAFEGVTGEQIKGSSTAGWCSFAPA